MDAIIKWIGGKNLFTNKLIEIMPEHHTYVEIFFGGGSLFFRKPKSKVEVVNDLNSELVNLYRVLKNNIEEFKKREQYELYSREVYYEYMKDFTSKKHFVLSDIERAFRFFYLINSSYNGEFGVGWSFSPDKSKASEFFNRFKDIDRAAQRFKSTYIENRDFEECIKTWDGEDTLIYADPPYFKAPIDDYYFKSYASKKTFDIHDHQRLYLALKKIKGKFILSYDDCEWVRERYSEFNIIDYKVHYSSATKAGEEGKFVNELIITNYDVNKIKKHQDIRQGTLEF